MTKKEYQYLHFVYGMLHDTLRRKVFWLSFDWNNSEIKGNEAVRKGEIMIIRLRVN